MNILNGIMGAVVGMIAAMFLLIVYNKLNRNKK